MSEIDSHWSFSPITITWPVFSSSSASLARCINCWTAIIHFALASLSWLVSSLLVKCGLTHVTIAPSWRIPKNTMANSGTFGAKIATTSPFLIPLLLRPEANFLLRSFTSENVYELFVEPQTFWKRKYFPWKATHYTTNANRPFPSSPQSLFQSESKCEIFVMIISSNFNMNENWFS